MVLFNFQTCKFDEFHPVHGRVSMTQATIEGFLRQRCNDFGSLESMALLNESCKIGQIGPKTRILVLVYILQAISTKSRKFMWQILVFLWFLKFERFCITLLVMRFLVFSKILTNQIMWKRSVKNFPFTTNLVISAQSMQKLKGFIEVKQFNNAVFEQNS